MGSNPQLSRMRRSLLLSVLVSGSLSVPGLDDYYHKINYLSQQVNHCKEENTNLRKYVTDLAEITNQNFKHTEMILNTRLAICAFKDEHRDLGLIQYDQLLPLQQALVMGKQYQPSSLLDPSSGVFSSPVSGLYQVSASAIVDTWEGGPRHAIFQFVFGKNRHEALLYADMASSEQGDLVHLSQTVFLHLEQGDSLHLEQVEGRSTSQATTVKKVMLCVVLNTMDNIIDYKSIGIHQPSPTTTQPPPPYLYKL
eukprot:TRINITY_DN21110_c0_g1_i1.p1 TRINITY_DN21110_c0_g1~~TRINITY_DN21110_c0_g1_i1.p1  ORF type:complete len:253 (-),score=65.58 TRINITY_DN21110_c0_g1_i1:70-828(-)